MAANVGIHNTIPKGGTPTISKENENFFRLELLLIEIGRKSLYYVFQTRYKGSLDIFLKSVEPRLKDLYKRKVIDSVQWGLIFPTAKIDQWDISLFCILLRSICCLPPPKAGWGKNPDTTDQSISADIERLRCLRNECQGHIPKAALTDVNFNILWKDIETVILRLSSNTLKCEVDAISTASFERSLYQRLLDSTQQWNQQEVMFSVYILTEYVDNLKELVTSNGEQIKLVENTLSKFEDGVTNQLPKIQDKNCTVEQMMEKVTCICNETLRCIVKFISSNDKKHKELSLHLQNIEETVHTILEMHKHIVELQTKTTNSMEDHGNTLRISYDLAKLTDSKIDHLIQCVQDLCNRSCHGDPNEDVKPKDYTFDRESSKYRDGNKTEKQNGNAIGPTCVCDFQYIHLVDQSEANKDREINTESQAEALTLKNIALSWSKKKSVSEKERKKSENDEPEKTCGEMVVENDEPEKTCGEMVVENDVEMESNQNSQSQASCADTKDQSQNSYTSQNDQSEANKDREIKDNRDKYEYFWKSHSPFSQWYYSKFTIDDTTYRCAEQFIMHSKATLMEDYKTARKIMMTKKPRDLNSLGQQVKHFNQQMWDDNCLAVVEEGNEAKFSQNLDLKNYLYSTYPRTLVEASPLDKIWGIGLAEDNPLAWDESTWNGKNLLGYALTRVRDRMMRKENIIQ